MSGLWDFYFKEDKSLFIYKEDKANMTVAREYRFRLVQISCGDVVTISWSFMVTTENHKLRHFESALSVEATARGYRKASDAL